jgi:small subunit ribosomal protein S14
MKHLIAKDKRIRKVFFKKEIRRYVLKSLVKNQFLSVEERTKFHNDLKDLHSFPMRIKNRCIVTGRAKSVYRAFGLTRMKVREAALFGLLNNVKKSSW